ncbi:YafY family transcriptional regulator [Dactylosporangium vinaceum]|uniref:Helix-turn-helix transcriptional regulator n=1 Tax=Dactylosporangium vinaceum TaxID=53362 RepID=A0ABV5M5N6_9ACTN|nr:YafY family protein [Dactylosporangium vinaceum]UAB95624.1 YafY family transcriptional regulator [Dactylosporangium vinaceum]
MRAGRLLSTLLLLQTRGRLTAQQIADELEVSVRTVYRDIEALSASGVPVYADRGPAGGFALLDGYRTNLTGLSTDEAAALFLNGSGAGDLGLGRTLEAARLKLLAALPTEQRTMAGRIQERVHVDAPGWFRDPEAPPHLEAVATAVWEQQRIRISYCKWDGESVERPLAPLGLVLKGTAWYLVATGRTRTNAFRVARIAAVTVLDEHFERPADFDLRQYWGAFAERLEETLYSGGSATVRLSPRAVRLWFLLGPVAGRALRDSAEPEAGGWVRVVLPIQSIEHARVDFGRFGADIEVLEPAELRAAMRATAEAMTRLYSAP